MNPREAAKELSDRAREAKVRFPKVFDESKLMQVCGATVVRTNGIMALLVRACSLSMTACR